MNPKVCLHCEEPLILVEDAEGKTFYQCEHCDCGQGLPGAQSSLVNTYEEAMFSQYCIAGEGAKPEGYKYGASKMRLSQGRKKGIANIKLLCQHFAMPGDLQKEMLGIFQNLKSRQLEAAAGAVFVTLARQASSQGLKPKMTLHQVSSIIDVSIHKIALAMKLLKKQEIVNQMGNGAITDPPDVIRAVLPDFPLRDPISGSDIKNKVTTLAGKIIQLIQRRSSQSLDPNCLTLAASHLAFQSCCYQQEIRSGPDVHISSDKRGSTIPLETFLREAKFTVNKSLVRSVCNSSRLIHRELKKLLEKMPWIHRRARTSLHLLVVQHVEEILQLQELTCGLLSEEAEARRRDEPAPAQIIIPRELTAEEEAALEREELSEKDLPDDELSGYVRSAQEVESLQRWMGDESAVSDSDN